MMSHKVYVYLCNGFSQQWDENPNVKSQRKSPCEPLPTTVYSSFYSHGKILQGQNSVWINPTRVNFSQGKKSLQPEQKKYFAPCKNPLRSRMHPYSVSDSAYSSSYWTHTRKKTRSGVITPLLNLETSILFLKNWTSGTFLAQKHGAEVTIWDDSLLKHLYINTDEWLCFTTCPHFLESSPIDRYCDRAVNTIRICQIWTKDLQSCLKPPWTYFGVIAMKRVTYNWHLFSRYIYHC